MSILSDPQTSGGLLISVDCRKAEQLLAAIRLGGDKDAAIIGKVIEGKKGHIYLR
jgi:selenide,water dikinase